MTYKLSSFLFDVTREVDLKVNWPGEAEHLPHQPKVKGLSPATAASTGSENIAKQA
jgi:hypothetical protein